MGWCGFEWHLGDWAMFQAHRVNGCRCRCHESPAVLIWWATLGVSREGGEPDKESVKFVSQKTIPRLSCISVRLLIFSLTNVSIKGQRVNWSSLFYCELFVAHLHFGDATAPSATSCIPSTLKGMDGGLELFQDSDMNEARKFGHHPTPKGSFPPFKSEHAGMENLK